MIVFLNMKVSNCILCSDFERAYLCLSILLLTIQVSLKGFPITFCVWLFFCNSFFFSHVYQVLIFLAKFIRTFTVSHSVLKVIFLKYTSTRKQQQNSKFACFGIKEFRVSSHCPILVLFKLSIFHHI